MAAGVRPKKIGKVNLFKIDWTGKEKKETSPTYNISGEIDGIGEIGGEVGLAKLRQEKPILVATSTNLLIREVQELLAQ